MDDDNQQRYDDVHYPGFARRSTHPDRLATLATLFGLRPAELPNVRVLELGCGDGGNIIPIAMSLPGSQCVGIDLSPRAIAIGEGTIKELGLDNVRLHAMDIMELGPEFGLFDYIIAHGLYSWVPPAVQEKILSVCRDNLAPEGIAFISFNTYPGWHMRSMTREMMLYHARNFNSSDQQVSQARAFLSFIGASAVSTSNAYTTAIDEAIKEKESYSDPYLYHDDLARINIPLYFHEFASQLADHGLQYLAESNFMEMQDFMLKPEAIETMNTIADGNLLVREQLLDFLKGRRFRQTLLCHTAQQITRTISPERLRPLLISSQITPLPGDGETVATTNTFKTSLGATIEVTHPVASRVLHEVIQQAPARVGFNDLLTMIDSIPEVDLPSEHQPNEHQPEHDERRTQLLGEILLSLYAEDFIELHTFQPTVAHAASDFPVASPLAQLQARTATTVTNLLHQRIELGDTIGRRMVRLLDGSRNRGSIVEDLAQEMADKSDISLEAIAADLEADLHQLARLGLLLK